MNARIAPAELDRFREIWLVDFEFMAVAGEPPEPVCCVAMGLRSGQVLRWWQDELQVPLPIGADDLFVAYYAPAEMSCYLALGWQPPPNVLDLWAEFQVFTNGRVAELGLQGTSLLSALHFFGLAHLDPDVKAQWRERILAGPPFGPRDRVGILDYCESDARALQGLVLPLLKAVSDRPHWLSHALLRGRYMVAVARMEAIGTPVDHSLYTSLGRHWDAIRGALIDEVRKEYPVFQGLTLKHAAFEAWLRQHDLPWPRTESGRLSTSADTFKEMARQYPIVAPIREVLHNLGKLRITDISVGRDGRNRTMLSPFRARSGRNQPSNAKFIFGPSVWLRSLIAPPPGFALAYIDFSSQEIAIAAALSGDQVMRRAYESGDPYMAFAVDAGLAPPGASKSSHKALRDRCKAVVLGTLYGMQEQTLARNLGIVTAEARELLRAHRSTYAVFWDWSRRVSDSALLGGYLDTCFGWRLHITGATKPTSLLNHPMQAHGAEMLRLACIFATEAGIGVCAPVHDALLVEAPVDQLDDVVARTREHMAHASRIVLGGFEVRTDADLVLPGERYSDPRGEALWAKVMGLLAQADEGQSAPNLVEMPIVVSRCEQPAITQAQTRPFPSVFPSRDLVE